MNINFLQTTKPLKHTWSNCVGAGRANEGLRADWQAHLKMVKQSCGFRYVRFHGLLHDDMHVYSEENGQPVYNFQYIDQLFDSLLAMEVRPFVEFSFMPADLVSNDQTLFWWKGRVAPPNNYTKWAALIEALVRHWLARYGAQEVRRWYFEVWNEPNLNAFWSGTKAQYLELYRVTVNAVKSADAHLRVGGPATSNYVPDGRFDGEVEDTAAQLTFKVEDLDALEWHGVWIRDFLEYCARENLPVDFVSCHPYPTDFALDGYGQSSGRTRNRDSLYQDIMWLRKEIAQSAYPNVELHLTEWSCSPSSRDYSHDYLPAAAYVLRSNLRCSGLVDSLSYWTFTDVFEEVGAGPKAFHGGFGMVNLQGIKKPVFHAYRILNDLGTEELARGENWIATKKGDRLCMAFCHYPPEYQQTVPMSMFPDSSLAQACQEAGEDCRYSFTITGLTPGQQYTLRLLERDTTPVMLWNQMGAPASPDLLQTEQLRRRGDTLREVSYQADDDGNLCLDFTVPAWTIGQLV